MWLVPAVGPLVYWLILLGATGVHIPDVDSALSALDGRFHYEHFVPHILIYITYFAQESSFSMYIQLRKATNIGRYDRYLAGHCLQRCQSETFIS